MIFHLANFRLNRLYRMSLLPLLFIFIFSLTTVVEAAVVKAVRGKRVLVEIQDKKIEKDQVYNVVNAQGRTVGVVKIMAVRGKQAMAVLGGGRAQSGMNLALRTPSKPSTERPAPTLADGKKDQKETRDSDSFLAGSTVGGMVGFNMASSDIKLAAPSNRKVSLDGNGFSAKAFIDYPLFSFLGIRGFAGLEQFNTSGETDPLCNDECKAEINYLSLDVWGRLPFLSGESFKPWVGGGVSVLIPLSKTVTAFEEKSVTNTSLLSLGGGLDYYLNPTSYIPLQVEYNMYPSSSDVSASSINLRVGYGVNF